MRDPYLAMALNNAWANATLYSAISGMSDADFAAPRPGFLGSLKATLNHIHVIDLYYMDALEGGGVGRSLRDQDDIASVSALARAQADADLRLTRFCNALTPAILQETCLTDRPEGAVEEQVGSILLHIFQHQVHHRGQAHTMVADAGIDPPQLDEFHLQYMRAPTAAAYFAD
ncbi:DinB family protein [Oricola sp.]|uniref:DinB family protein n=1 Tax=Oricola sp. TaxID=1979950 RepID=UPI003BAD5B0B